MTEPRGRAADRSLVLYGDALRAARASRRKLVGRTFAAGLLISALAISVVFPPRPWLVWNASASAPVGLYRVGQPHDLEVGEMVIARVPRRYRQLAAERHYLPVNVPLVKRVAAAPGDRVCAAGARITVDGRSVAGRRPFDGRGRPMPWWNGCVTLRHGALFLLTDDPDSFDSRYFGPTEHADIIGRARLLWAR